MMVEIFIDLRLVFWYKTILYLTIQKISAMKIFMTFKQAYEWIFLFFNFFEGWNAPYLRYLP